MPKGHSVIQEDVLMSDVYFNYMKHYTLTTQQIGAIGQGQTAERDWNPAMIQGLVLFKAHQISMKKEQMQEVSPLKKEQFQQNSEKIYPNLRSNFKNNLVVNAVLKNCSALAD